MLDYVHPSLLIQLEEWDYTVWNLPNYPKPSQTQSLTPLSEKFQPEFQGMSSQFVPCRTDLTTIGRSLKGFLNSGFILQKILMCDVSPTLCICKTCCNYVEAIHKKDLLKSMPYIGEIRALYDLVFRQIPALIPNNNGAWNWIVGGEPSIQTW